jgi:hypothetical protein
MTKRAKASPLSNFFFPDGVMYAPSDLKKYGLRLKRGEQYRLYSAIEVRELVKAGRIVPMAGVKPVIEEKVPATAKATPTVEKPRTEAEEEAHWIEHRMKLFRFHAPGKILDAIERWGLIPNKSGNGYWKRKRKPLTKEERVQIWENFQRLSITLEWVGSVSGGEIKVVVQDKENTLPPLGPTHIERAVRGAKARLAKKAE